MGGVYSQQYGDVMLINSDSIIYIYRDIYSDYYIYIEKIIGSITNLI